MMQSYILAGKICLVLVSSFFYQLGFKQPRTPILKKQMNGDHLFEILGPHILRFKKLAEPPLALFNILFLLALHETRSLFVYTPICPTLHTRTSSTSSSTSHFTTVLMFCGCILVVLGGSIRFRCIRLLDSMFTYALTLTETHTLITSGPYRYCRHPAYTGLYFIAAGEVMVHGSTAINVYFNWSEGCRTVAAIGLLHFSVWLVVVAYTCIGLNHRSIVEDQLMEKRFGSTWMEWRNKTPYRYFPGII